MWTILILAFSTSMSFQDSHVFALQCSPSQESFEIISGFLFEAPESVEFVKESFSLTECLSFCRHNAKCRAINFEIGLCVLFNSDAQERPESLVLSKLPEPTTFAQKVCLGELNCAREWIYEKVSNYKLLGNYSKIVQNVTLVETCIDLCLKEQSFECRSANYIRKSNECQMNERDRHSMQRNFQESFVQAEDGTEYLENNCVDPAERLCKFSAINGKMLKTVDVVIHEVTTTEGCRKKCLSADFRCQAFDLGEIQNSVCRLSHLSSPSLFHTGNPYRNASGSTVFEVDSCYNVTVKCRSHEMVAAIRSTKLFKGKIYAKSRPFSCFTKVQNSWEFEMKMPYNDLNCDVKQQGDDKFENYLFIQHHDIIITNEDLGVKLGCQFELTNKSVIHGKPFGVNTKPEKSYISKVAAAKISMTVTDKQGHDLFASQLGEPIVLKFQITDHNSPYDFFVRELVAMDGKDTDEIVLIDMGCPTDSPAMDTFSKVNNNDATLKIPIKTFKFPASELVQFKALVKTCLAECKPAECHLKTTVGLRHEFGKKQRRHLIDRNRREEIEDEDEVVVEHTIRIKDKVRLENQATKNSAEDTGTTRESSISAFTIATVGVALATISLVQLITVFIWAFLY